MYSAAEASEQTRADEPDCDAQHAQTKKAYHSFSGPLIQTLSDSDTVTLSLCDPVTPCDLGDPALEPL